MPRKQVKKDGSKWFYSTPKDAAAATMSAKPSAVNQVKDSATEEGVGTAGGSNGLCIHVTSSSTENPGSFRHEDLNVSTLATTTTTTTTTNSHHADDQVALRDCRRPQSSKNTSSGNVNGQLGKRRTNKGGGNNQTLHPVAEMEIHQQQGGGGTTGGGITLATVKRVDGVEPLPFIELPVDTDLNQVPKNYLDVDLKYGVHRQAPWFQRNKNQATRSLLQAAVTEMFPDEDVDRERDNEEEEEESVSSSSSSKKDSHHSSNPERISVITSGTTLKTVFDSHVEEGPMMLYVHRLGPSILVSSQEDTAPSSVDTTRHHSLFAKALYHTTTLVNEFTWSAPTQTSSSGATGASSTSGVTPTASRMELSAPTSTSNAASSLQSKVHSYGNVFRWGLNGLDVILGVDSVLVKDEHSGLEMVLKLKESVGSAEGAQLLEDNKNQQNIMTISPITASLHRPPVAVKDLASILPSPSGGISWDIEGTPTPLEGTPNSTSLNGSATTTSSREAIVPSLHVGGQPILQQGGSRSGSGGDHHSLEGERVGSATLSVNKKEALEYWFDAMLTNVRNVAVCIHHRGVLQEYRVLPVNEVLGLTGASVEASMALNFTGSVLQWLSQHCVREGANYVVLRDGESNSLKLFELGSSWDSSGVFGFQQHEGEEGEQEIQSAGGWRYGVPGEDDDVKFPVEQESTTEEPSAESQQQQNEDFASREKLNHFVGLMCCKMGQYLASSSSSTNSSSSSPDNSTGGGNNSNSKPTHTMSLLHRGYSLLMENINTRMVSNSNTRGGGSSVSASATTGGGSKRNKQPNPSSTTASSQSPSSLSEETIQPFLTITSLLQPTIHKLYNDASSSMLGHGFYPVQDVAEVEMCFEKFIVSIRELLMMIPSSNNSDSPEGGSSGSSSRFPVHRILTMAKDIIKAGFEIGTRALTLFSEVNASYRSQKICYKAAFKRTSEPVQNFKKVSDALLQSTLKAMIAIHGVLQRLPTVLQPNNGTASGGGLNSQGAFPSSSGTTPLSPSTPDNGSNRSGGTSPVSAGGRSSSVGASPASATTATGTDVASPSQFGPLATNTGSSSSLLVDFTDIFQAFAELKGDLVVAAMEGAEGQQLPGIIKKAANSWVNQNPKERTGVEEFQKLPTDPPGLSFIGHRYYSQAAGHSSHILMKSSHIYYSMGTYFLKLNRFTKALESLHRSKQLLIASGKTVMQKGMEVQPCPSTFELTQGIVQFAIADVYYQQVLGAGGGSNHSAALQPLWQKTVHEMQHAQHLVLQQRQEEREREQEQQSKAEDLRGDQKKQNGKSKHESSSSQQSSQSTSNETEEDDITVDCRYKLCHSRFTIAEALLGYCNFQLGPLLKPDGSTSLLSEEQCVSIKDTLESLVGQIPSRIIKVNLHGQNGIALLYVRLYTALLLNTGNASSSTVGAKGGKDSKFTSVSSLLPALVKALRTLLSRYQESVQQQQQQQQQKGGKSSGNCKEKEMTATNPLGLLGVHISWKQLLSVSLRDVLLATMEGVEAILKVLTNQNSSSGSTGNNDLGFSDSTAPGSDGLKPSLQACVQDFQGAISVGSQSSEGISVEMKQLLEQRLSRLQFSSCGVSTNSNVSSFLFALQQASFAVSCVVPRSSMADTALSDLGSSGIAGTEKHVTKPV